MVHEIADAVLHFYVEMAQPAGNAEHRTLLDYLTGWTRTGTGAAAVASVPPPPAPAFGADDVDTIHGASKKKKAGARASADFGDILTRGQLFQGEDFSWEEGRKKEKKEEEEKKKLED